MKRLLTFLISERVVMSVILLNAAAMTASGFYEEGDPAKAFFDGIDYACVVYYVIEAILKMSHFGWRRYFSSNWNRFDFLVTVLCLPILWEPFVTRPLRLGWAPIVRMGRLFRLFRMLRFIPRVDHLLLGIRRALRASVGIFLALFVINLILALTATMLFGDTDPDRFGDPALSFYSIFRIFTVEGWYEYPDALEGAYPGASWFFGIRLFFMIAVMVGGLLGLSLANAVFLDEMTMDNTQELEDKIDRLTEHVKLLQEQLRDRLDGP